MLRMTDIRFLIYSSMARLLPNQLHLSSPDHRLKTQPVVTPRPVWKRLWERKMTYPSSTVYCKTPQLCRQQDPIILPTRRRRHHHFQPTTMPTFFEQTLPNAFQRELIHQLPQIPDFIGKEEWERTRPRIVPHPSFVPKLPWETLAVVCNPQWAPPCLTGQKVRPPDVLGHERHPLPWNEKPWYRRHWPLGRAPCCCLPLLVI